MSKRIEKYSEIIDHFEGLQVVNALSDNGRIEITKFKTPHNLRLDVRTLLVTDKHLSGGNMVFYYFKNFTLRNIDPHSPYHGNARENFYFPFTIFLDRQKDEIDLIGLLPSINADKDRYYSSSQLLKFYSNTFIYDLELSGFKNAKISIVQDRFLELHVTATKNNSTEDILGVYNFVRGKNIEIFNSFC